MYGVFFKVTAEVLCRVVFQRNFYIAAQKLCNRSGDAYRYSVSVASLLKLLTRVEDGIFTKRPLAGNRRLGTTEENN